MIKLKFNFRNLDLNKVLIGAGALALVFVVVFLFWWNKEIVVSKGGKVENAGVKSSISGIECERAKERPFAIMLAGDREAIPLSGLSQADMVFEMPVAPNSITRFMAVYQCEQPKEIGSIRSSREDFIALAKGLKAIYAHWGGEHEALTKLNNGIIDNIDAMKYEGTVFYRKKGAPPPHNGFTDLDLLSKKAEDLSYNLEDQFSGYPHIEKVKNKTLSNLANLIPVGYAKPFDALWVFDSNKNVYKRSRNGDPEVDKNTSEQVSASVVVLMKTDVAFWRDQYMRVDVEGEGEAQIYQGGIVINGKWKKDPVNLDSKLSFYDTEGKEIKFLPGKIWVEIVSDN